jgi:predicted Zn finger-like uncharacterized protein
VFVTCDSCHAEYEIDDAKIPARGARLRCTSCKHSFVVVPPGGGDLARAEELARAARSAAASRAPEPEPQPAAADEEAGLDGESDWEFNDVVGSPDAESGANASGVEQPGAGSSAGWGDIGSAEDVVDDLLGSSGAVERDAIGAVDDLLGEIDFSDPQPRTAPEHASAPASASREPGGRGAASAFEALEADLAATAADEFESLADWGDLAEPAGGAPDSVQPQAAEPPDASGDSAPRHARSAPAASARQPASVALGAARAEPRVGDALALAVDVPSAARWSDRAAAAAGWAAVAVLTAFSLASGLTPARSDARAQPASWRGSGFEVDGIAGRWVDNAASGAIYVVSGRIRREPGAAGSAQSTIGVTALDGAGREVGVALAPLAAEIPERVLREATLREIEDLQAFRTLQLAGLDESWVSFDAVLGALPQAAARFELRATAR